MNWMIYLKTTETCNLNCKHCFTNGSSGRKIYWQKNKIIKWLADFSKYASLNDTVHCEFHGGEPFLVDSSEMRDVWYYTHRLLPNVTYGATSNLVFKMYEKDFALIKDCFNNRIGTSWDPKIRFENQRQYKLWRDNVKELLGRGATVKLFISVTKDTLAIEPIVLLRWIRKLGVQEVSFERLTRDGSANKHPDIFPNNKEQDAWFLKMHEQSEEYKARNWFENEFLETIYDKFETGFLKGGTFCRDCEEKLFTINADGSIAGCPNSAPSSAFGTIDQPLEELINSPDRLNNIACERSRNPLCYNCEVFQYCGGDCHQLPWEDEICGAPKSLMKNLSIKTKRWIIKEV